MIKLFDVNLEQIDQKRIENRKIQHNFNWTKHRCKPETKKGGGTREREKERERERSSNRILSNLTVV